MHTSAIRILHLYLSRMNMHELWITVKTAFIFSSIVLSFLLNMLMPSARHFFAFILALSIIHTSSLFLPLAQENRSMDWTARFQRVLTYRTAYTYETHSIWLSFEPFHWLIRIPTYFSIERAFARAIFLFTHCQHQSSSDGIKTNKLC